MTNVGSMIPAVKRVYIPNITGYKGQVASSSYYLFIDDEFQDAINEYAQRAKDGVVIEGYISLQRSASSSTSAHDTIASFKMLQNALETPVNEINYMNSSSSVNAGTRVGLRKSTYSSTNGKWYYAGSDYSTSYPYLHGCIIYFYLDYGGGV